MKQFYRDYFCCGVAIANYRLLGEPHKWLNILAVFAVSMIILLIFMGIVSLFRNHPTPGSP